MIAAPKSRIPNPKHQVVMRHSLAILTLAATIPFLGGCSTTGVKELRKPLTDNSLAAEILNPRRLSPETREILREEGLAAGQRKDRDAAITELDRRFRENPTPGYRVALAELCVNEGNTLARKSEPVDSVGYFLCAAEFAYPEVIGGKASPEREVLTKIYNHSCSRVATILFEATVDKSRPGKRTISGPLHPYQLSLRDRGIGYFDPNYVDTIEAAEYLEVKGLNKRNVTKGIGGALVGHRQQTPDREKEQPFLSHVGMGFPLTSLLRYSDSGNEVEVHLHDPAVRDHVRVDGRDFALSADFTAPLAYLLKYSLKGNSGFKGMLHPDEYASSSGLFQVEPFHPDQIPVILVHGLMSSPQTWLDAINELRADPVLREKYQPLFYYYPTGFPIAYNSAGFRDWLAKFFEHYDPGGRLPAMRETVLVGHSMGCLLSNMQIRDSGDALYDTLFNKPLDEIAIPEEDKETLRKLFFFDANPNVRRAIFMAGPHRGADLAAKPIGKLGRELIKLPLDALLSDTEIEPVEGMTPLMVEFLQDAPDSIASLTPHWPILEGILEQPVADRVTYHSIIGNHNNKVPLEDSTDTVVPYWSSHLDGAVSEKIVTASHTTITPNPVAIEELRRILYLHVGAPYTANAIATGEDEAPAKRRKMRGPLHGGTGPRH